MATRDSDLIVKKRKERGLYSGKIQSITGSIRLGISSGLVASVALADLIRMVPVGENVRPVRLTLTSTPLSGTPVLTNPTFTAGVAPYSATTYTRPDGNTYPALTADTDQLATAIAIDADNMKSVVEVARPVADSVSKYGPYYVTLTPSGAGAFSVAGGDILLQLCVEFEGEVKPDNLVYSSWIDQKVK